LPAKLHALALSAIVAMPQMPPAILENLPTLLAKLVSERLGSGGGGGGGGITALQSLPSMVFSTSSATWCRSLCWFDFGMKIDRNYILTNEP
jgi:hypothetical protein